MYKTEDPGCSNCEVALLSVTRSHFTHYDKKVGYMLRLPAENRRHDLGETDATLGLQGKLINT